ncbi:MAG TPA: hypothetical protein VFR87_20070 [Nocardioidaceae bacterium]|nr:hypothetical protein [Nocardioidaceae bacterium]
MSATLVVAPAHRGLFHVASYVLATGDGEWGQANRLTVSRHGLGYARAGGRTYAVGRCVESPLREIRTVSVLDVTQVSLG